MQGRGSGAVRDFALYGETTGETDEFGLPVRYNWAAEYRGQAMVVYGHTPVPEPEWLNRTINIDTGCVFGGKLTALRYPERELVVGAGGARPTTSRPSRSCPRRAGRRRSTAQQRHDDLLDLDDVLGQAASSTTRLRRGRHDPRGERDRGARGDEPLRGRPAWLIYLPPTMSPSETSARAGPARAPGRGLRLLPAATASPQVVCEEKHMGSRAVVVVCRDEDAARSRFGVVGDGHRASCYTRTGRRFFDDADARGRRCSRACATRARRPPASGTSSRPTGSCLDCELMPWSAKAQELLRAAVRRRRRRRATLRARTRAPRRGTRPRQRTGRLPLLERFQARAADAGRALRRRLPALLLAGRVARRPAARAVPPPRQRGRGPRRQGPPLAHGDARRLRRRPTPSSLLATPYRVVDLDRPGERGGGDRLVGGADRTRAARAWWSSRSTSSHAGRRGLVQPARQVPRPRVPAHHLRARVHRAREPRAAARARPRAQALARAARVRARHRGARALRPQRAAAAASTSASSACSRWRASRSTRGSSSCRSRSRFRRPWRSGRSTAGSQTGRSGAGTR